MANTFTLNLKSNVAEGLESASASAAQFAQDGLIPATVATRQLSKSGEELRAILREVFEENRQLTVSMQQQAETVHAVNAAHREQVIIVSEVRKGLIQTAETVVSLVNNTRELWASTKKYRDSLGETKESLMSTAVGQALVTQAALRALAVIPRVGAALSGWVAVGLAVVGALKAVQAGLEATGEGHKLAGNATEYQREQWAKLVIKAEETGQTLEHVAREMKLSLSDIGVSEINNFTLLTGTLGDESTRVASVFTENFRDMGSMLAQTYEDDIRPTLIAVGESVDEEVSKFVDGTVSWMHSIGDALVYVKDAAKYAQLRDQGGTESWEDFRAGEEQRRNIDNEQANVDRKQAGAQAGFKEQKAMEERLKERDALQRERDRLSAIQSLDEVQGEIVKLQEKMAQRRMAGLKSTAETDDKGKPVKLTAEQEKANKEIKQYEADRELLNERKRQLEKQATEEKKQAEKKAAQERVELAKSYRREELQINLEFYKTEESLEIQRAEAEKRPLIEIHQIRLRNLEQQAELKKRYANDEKEWLQAESEYQRSILRADHDYRLSLLKQEAEAFQKAVEERQKLAESEAAAHAAFNATSSASVLDARIRGLEREAALAGRKTKDLREAARIEEDAARKIAKVREEAIEKEGREAEQAAKTELERQEAKQRTLQRLLEQRIQAEVEAEARKLKLVDDLQVQAEQAKEARKQAAQQALGNAGFDAQQFMQNQDPRKVAAALAKRAGEQAGQKAFDDFNANPENQQKFRDAGAMEKARMLRERDRERQQAIEQEERRVRRQFARGEVDPRALAAAQADVAGQTLDGLKAGNQNQKDLIDSAKEQVKQTADILAAQETMQQEIANLKAQQQAVGQNAAAQRQRAQRGSVR